jgi:cation diffusion facilitator CzcD-associated flavoprotein CzcO
MKKFSGHGVIVGGGLTSAHLCSQLAPKGNIDLLIRRDRRVKQYDLDLSWMKTSPDGRRQLRQKFEQASLEERVATNKSVRDGGSITPELNATLSKLEADSLLKVHEFTEIVSAAWNGCWSLTLNTNEVITADYLICATGTSVDISADPLLGSLQTIHPLRVVGGLPVLSEQLQWGELPIHLMGNLAALELGPDAVNMSGALRGAYRIWPAVTRNSSKKKTSAKGKSRQVAVPDRFTRAALAISQQKQNGL